MLAQWRMHQPWQPGETGESSGHRSPAIGRSHTLARVATSEPRTAFPFDRSSCGIAPAGGPLAIIWVPESRDEHRMSAHRTEGHCL